MQVRRLSAVTGKLSSDRKRVVFPCMKPNGEVDVRGDSGRRKLTGGEGHGVRGADLLGRGNSTKGESIAHLCDLLWQVPQASGAIKRRC